MSNAMDREKTIRTALERGLQMASREPSCGPSKKLMTAGLSALSALQEERERMQAALQNIGLLSTRELRHGGGDSWGHIYRFCKEAGYKSSILRADAAIGEPANCQVILDGSPRRVRAANRAANRVLTMPNHPMTAAAAEGQSLMEVTTLVCTCGNDEFRLLIPKAPRATPGDPVGWSCTDCGKLAVVSR